MRTPNLRVNRYKLTILTIVFSSLSVAEDASTANTEPPTSPTTPTYQLVRGKQFPLCHAVEYLFTHQPAARDSQHCFAPLVPVGDISIPNWQETSFNSVQSLLLSSRYVEKRTKGGREIAEISYDDWVAKIGDSAYFPAASYFEALVDIDHDGHRQRIVEVRYERCESQVEDSIMYRGPDIIVADHNSKEKAHPKLNPLLYTENQLIYFKGRAFLVQQEMKHGDVNVYQPSVEKRSGYVWEEWICQFETKAK